MEFLRRYGVTTVLDLRSEAESLRAPSRMAGQPGMNCRRIPLMGRDITDAAITPADPGTDIGQLYLSILEQPDIIRELFSLLAAAPEGRVLFHCTAGKDRTGILAMLLLSLAGADREDCMTNYAQSYPNLCRNRALFHDSAQAQFPGMEQFKYSHPESILPCYERIMERFGAPPGSWTFAGSPPPKRRPSPAACWGRSRPPARTPPPDAGGRRTAFLFQNQAGAGTISPLRPPVSSAAAGSGSGGGNEENSKNPCAGGKKQVY